MVDLRAIRVAQTELAAADCLVAQHALVCTVLVAHAGVVGLAFVVDAFLVLLAVGFRQAIYAFALGHPAYLVGTVLGVSAWCIRNADILDAFLVLVAVQIDIASDAFAQGLAADGLPRGLRAVQRALAWRVRYALLAFAVLVVVAVAVEQTVDALLCQQITDLLRCAAVLVGRAEL